MADYTKVDPYARARKRTATGYAPMPSTVDTGIPAYTPPEDGGFTGGQQPVDTGIPQTSPADQIRKYPSIWDAYSQYLGRTPSQSEVYSHAGGGSWAESDPRIQSSISNIMNSPEAASYAQRQQTPAATATAQPQASTSALAGWDQTKWTDPSHETPKYVVGRILSMYGASPDALQKALPAIQAAIPGTTLAGRDSLNIPGVGIVDVGGNFNDSNPGNDNWWWGPDSEQGQGATAAAPAASTSAAGASGGGGYGGGSNNNAVWSKILELMGQSPIDVSTSPVYKGAIDAYSVQAQRAKERDRNAIAERMNAEGTLNTGGFSDRVLAAEQKQGEDTASFAGNLGVRALEMQRDEILQALQLGAGLMTDEQRLALTEKLGLINANLQQQQITNQANQYDSSLGWDMAQYGYGANASPWSMIFGQ